MQVLSIAQSARAPDAPASLIKVSQMQPGNTFLDAKEALCLYCGPIHSTALHVAVKVATGERLFIRGDRSFEVVKADVRWQRIN